MMIKMSVCNKINDNLIVDTFKSTIAERWRQRLRHRSQMPFRPTV